MSSDQRNLLSTGRAAELCSVTPDTILKWIKRGRLSGVRTAGVGTAGGCVAGST
jgi:excisionase family DNA binding protein